MHDFLSATKNRLAHAAQVMSSLLPGQCLACGDATPTPLCACCTQQFWPPEQRARRCVQCAIRLARTGAPYPLGAGLIPCGHCRADPPAFDVTLALADYRAPLDMLAITLKFKGRPGLSDDLAHRLSVRLHAHVDACRRARLSSMTDPLPDILLPAPLSAERLMTRGYNQAWELTRRLARATGIAAHAGVLRRTHTAAQSGLSLTARRRNMRHAIALSPGHANAIRGLHVGVIDDVMTTGATCDAMARVLKAAGARRVSNLVVFRTA